MIYLVIIIVIIVVLTMYFLQKNNTNKDSKILKKEENLPIKENAIENGLKVEELSIDAFDNSVLTYEITDKNVLSRINNLVPKIFQTTTTVDNTIQSDKLYKVIIPAGEKLSNSKNIQGAKRAFYHGDKGIKGHADLIKANQTGAKVANNISTGMNVASVIVGQYYMTQIDNKLKKINDEISKISSFQQSEYISKILALIVQVKRISTFQAENIENKQIRESDLNMLKRLEDDCIKLLGQANIQIKESLKEENLDYKKYCDKTEQINNWNIYQNMLLNILYQIADLKYTLSLGEISNEQLKFILSTYEKQVNESHESLISWHEKYINQLEINTEESRRKRQGIDGAIHWLPGLIKDDLNFVSIPEETKNMIENQSTNYGIELEYNNKELFDKDVNIISKDGKIYYLP